MGEAGEGDRREGKRAIGVRRKELGFRRQRSCGNRKLTAYGWRRKARGVGLEALGFRLEAG